MILCFRDTFLVCQHGSVFKGNWFRIKEIFKSQQITWYLRGMCMCGVKTLVHTKFRNLRIHFRQQNLHVEMVVYTCWAEINSCKLLKNSMFVNISSVMMACYRISEWELSFHWEWLVENWFKTITSFAYFQEN